MAVFYPLKVKGTKKETHDAISIKFEVPDELKEKFRYQAGQYLTLRVYVDGKRHHRAYSLCSSPVIDPDPMVTTKRVVDGVVSIYLNENLRIGDVIEVFPPMGKFTVDLNPDHQKIYVLFGGGSGITPLMSLLKTILHEEPMSMVFLVYGNYDENSIIFKDELDQVKQQYGERFHLTHTLSHPSPNWTGKVGMLDRHVVLDLLKNDLGLQKEDEAEYYICGPSAMMEQVRTALKEHQIPSEKIHIEYFSAPLPDLNEAQQGFAESEGENEEDSDFEEADVTILLEGEEYHIKVKPDEKILDIALDNDIDPPYACQMGICTTCKAFLHEGKVEMEENEGLTDQEVEEGYILSCQSHPRTAKIKIEYE